MAATKTTGATKAKATKVQKLTPTATVEGKGPSAAVVGDRLVWGTTRGVYAFSLADGATRWKGGAELIEAFDAGTAACGGDAAVALRGVGLPMQVRASVYRAEDGSLVREDDVDTHQTEAVAALGAAVAVRAVDFGQPLTAMSRIGPEGVQRIEVDGGGFSPGVDAAGTPTRCIVAVQRYDAAAARIEQGVRAYDAAGRLAWTSPRRLAWTSPRRLVATRGAEHGVLVWDDARGLVLLDPETGAERWSSRVAEARVSVAGAVTSEHVALAIAPAGADADGVVHPVAQRLALLDAATGAVRWEVPVKGKRFFPRAPLVQSTRALFLDGAGALAVHDLATGALLASADEREGHAIAGSASHPYVAVIVRRPKEYCLRLYRVA